MEIAKVKIKGKDFKWYWSYSGYANHSAYVVFPDDGSVEDSLKTDNNFVCTIFRINTFQHFRQSNKILNS